MSQQATIGHPEALIITDTEKCRQLKDQMALQRFTKAWSILQMCMTYLLTSVNEGSSRYLGDLAFVVR